MYEFVCFEHVFYLDELIFVFIYHELFVIDLPW